MGDLYGNEKRPATAGSPEEILNYFGHLHSNPSGQKFLNSPLVAYSPPPHWVANAMPYPVEAAAGYSFELQEMQHGGIASYSAFGSGGYHWMENLESTGSSDISKRNGVLSEIDSGDCCDSEKEHDGCEMPAENVGHRRTTKRSRTSEIHNLSEKRRRSRINEKIKALQTLIPNSNKTDKVSMLDEAIEYLKQLQLKVQMLTLRNSLSINGMHSPAGLQQMQQPAVRLSYEEASGAFNSSRVASNYVLNDEK